MSVASMDPAGLILTLKHQRLFIDYAFLSGCTIFIYDCVLTLHLEIKLIWFSRWSYTKILFLLVRYTSLAAAFVIIYDRVMPDLSMRTCKVTFDLSVWLLISSVSLSHTILAIRTWAIWHMNKVIGIGLVILVVLDVAVRYPVIQIFLKLMGNAPPPYPGFRGCFFTTDVRIVWVTYVVKIVLYSCVLGLMVISAYRSYMRGKNSELWNVIHRDGIMYYVYILSFTILNLVCALDLPRDMVLLLSPMEELLCSLLTIRIILSIREAGNHQGQLLELHTECDSIPLSTIPLRILHNELIHHEQAA